MKKSKEEILESLKNELKMAMFIYENRNSNATVYYLKGEEEAFVETYQPPIIERVIHFKEGEFNYMSRRGSLAKIKDLYIYQDKIDIITTKKTLVELGGDVEILNTITGIQKEIQRIEQMDEESKDFNLIFASKGGEA